MSKRGQTLEDDDSEELELLRQQEEYFKQKNEGKVMPAAKFVTGTNISSNRPSLPPDPPKVNVQEQIANTFEAIPTDIQLPEITERFITSKIQGDLKFASKGFPQVARRDSSIKPAKGSIFSQQIKRLKTAEPVHDAPMDTSEVPPMIIKQRQPDGNFERISSISDSDRAQIHAQNQNILSQMSEEEKLAERQRLLGSMDPALIQFLRDQRAKKAVPPSTKTIQEQNQTAPVTLEQVKVANELLQKADSSNWLNFNRLEALKLAWMTDLNPETDKLNPEKFEARFDLNGCLLPYKVDEITDRNRHLFHHGDEPVRPGYSLQELLLLARSSQLQQSILALNVLAEVLYVQKTGIYDQVLDVPLEQVFFVVRVGIDENTPSKLNAALKAMRNLICFHLDETCLDSLMSFGEVGVFQPVLGVENVDEGVELNDQQLAEKDLVGCLIRTDILTRIRYIINTIKPPIETITYCLDILIRLARDKFAISKLIQHQNLLECVIRHFLPPTIKDSYEVPLPQTVKLLRILVARGQDLTKYHVTDLVVKYLYEENYGQNSFGLLLQVESMRFLSVMVYKGLYDASSDKNLLKRLLHYHIDNTDNSVKTTLIRQGHVSALFNLLSALVEKNVTIDDPVLKSCFSKWIGQFKLFNEWKCGHSQIVSSVLYYASICEKQGIGTGLDSLVESLFDSKGFDVATQRVINGSTLLNNFETHQSSSNLPSLGAATWFSMDHIVPVLQTNSCIPFLYCLSCYVLHSKAQKLKTTFLTHPKIRDYNQKLAQSQRYFNVSNWFSRCESHLIMNILKIAISIKKSLPEDLRLYYTIAFKGLCLFSAEQLEGVRSVLHEIIFCKGFFDVDILLANQRLDDSDTRDALDGAWRSLDEIREVYVDVLGLKVPPSQTPPLSFPTNATNVIPLDWIYTPLIRLYSDQENTPKMDPRAVLNCLRWILICETHFDSLASALSPTEKYVRLCCVFLGSDDLFLNAEVEEVLGRILTGLREEKMDFEEEISGLPNFKDFYNQLLQQYQAVSYGNKVFANALLYPLVKRHSVKYRKRLWSDFLGVVETCTLKCEEVWLNPKDLIEPADTDPSLCNAYRVALNSGAVKGNTVMHAIAVANVR